MWRKRKNNYCFRDDQGLVMNRRKPLNNGILCENRTVADCTEYLINIS